MGENVHSDRSTCAARAVGLIACVGLHDADNGEQVDETVPLGGERFSSALQANRLTS
jgi:hypothetical protein